MVSINTIYFGDNLDILRRYIKDESVDLIGTVDGKADAGIFLTLEEPTSSMISEAKSKGFINDSMGKSYPKIQILTVKEILNGKKPDLP